MSDESKKSDDLSHRQEAHDVLDELLDLEHQLANCKDNIDRGKIARDCQHLFHNLMSHFPNLGLEYSKLFHDGKPFQDIENSASPDVVVEWRKYVAAAIEMGVPISSRNRYRLATSLKALNSGETGNLFKQSVNSKRTRNWTIGHYQFLAVIHSHVLRGQGLKAAKARGIVAPFYGYSGDDPVRGWEFREMKKEPFKSLLTEWKNVAKELGKSGLKFRSNEEANLSLDEWNESSPDWNIGLEMVAMLLAEFNLEAVSTWYPLAQKKQVVPVPKLFPILRRN